MVFVGCFGEADNPLQEKVDEVEIDEVPKEAPDNENPLPQDPVPQGPVVRLVSEGVEWNEDRDWAFLSCYAEIDAPLDHHLFFYIERERHEQDDDFWGIPGEIENDCCTLFIIEKGNVRSGSFGTSTLVWDMHKKLVIRLLPGDERHEIELPRSFFFGEFKGEFPRDDGEVPKGYQFNPYQVGEPSEVFMSLTRTTSKKSSGGAKRRVCYMLVFFLLFGFRGGVHYV